MEVQAAQLSPGSSAAAYPRWVMLQEFCIINVTADADVDDEEEASCSGSTADVDDEEEASCSMTADANTLAAALTTAGDPIQVYLHLAEPPAVSAVCAKFPDGGCLQYSVVMAAHSDSLLIQASFGQASYGRSTFDHFVYNVGAAAADPPRPPSLSLLPPCYLSDEEAESQYSSSWHKGRMDRYLAPQATGMVRRGEDEIVVAEHHMVAVSKDTPWTTTAELVLFRSGEWSVKRPQISYGDHDNVGDLPSTWGTNTVVNVGDRQLCWVDLSTGLLFCDVFEETPGLQYLPLPMDPCYGRASNRNLCVTNGGDALKFINIFPRCCCGGDGATGCRRSLHAYTINTWTMRMSDMEWVKDGMVDATELWSLDAHKNLPRIQPDYPVVNMDEPHTIFLQLSRASHKQDGDTRLWLIMVDMKSKTLRLVTEYPGGCWAFPQRTLITSNVSCYLNSYRSCCTNVTWTGQSHIEGPQMLIVDEEPRDNDANNLMVPSSCQSTGEPAVQGSEILAALQEISSYGLNHYDMAKAYRILCHGNGHRCRSLLRLPESLRKDWLLMEIKATEEA